MRSLLLSLIPGIPLFTFAQQWNWAVDAGGTGNTDITWGIATDGQGNVYAAGSVGGAADFGCGTVSSLPAVAAGSLAKYDSTGACQWVRGITTGFNAAWAYGIAIDAQDRIYITGSYNGNADFGSGITLNSLGSDDIFLARYDVDGNCIWARRAGSSGANDEARGIALSDSGAVFISGFCGGTTITFDGISIPNPNNYRQIIIARYDSTGTVQWAKATSGNGQAKTARGIAVANDRLYITGQIGFVATTYQGLPITASASTSGLYLLACDLQGQPLWAHHYGPGDHEGMGIAADTIGNVFVAGRINGPLHLPDDTLASVSPDDDIIVMGFDSAGTYRWAKSTGSVDRDLAWDVKIDGLGNAYFGGQFEHTIDLFGAPLVSVGEEDLFIARFTTWGDVAWVKQGGSFQRDVGICVHPGNVGSKPVYTGGYFWGPVTYGSSTIDDVLNGDAMLVELSDTTAVDISTSIHAPASNEVMLLFPSPAHDHVFVRAARPVAGSWIVTPLGAACHVQQEANGAIDVRGLSPGVYFLRTLFDDGRVIARAFVKE